MTLSAVAATCYFQKKYLYVHLWANAGYQFTSLAVLRYSRGLNKHKGGATSHVRRHRACGAEGSHPQRNHSKGDALTAKVGDELDPLQLDVILRPPGNRIWVR